MAKRTIRLTDKQLNEAVKKTVSRILENMVNGDNGYYSVDEEDVQEAYDLFCKWLGEEEANEKIVTSLGQEKLAESLSFLFDLYGFKYWGKYLKDRENGITVGTFEF